jgi:undecaprenyl diphosphate synthase
LGDLDLLPEDVAQAMRKTEELTKSYDKARLNVCLCYNSKDEILTAYEATVEQMKRG